MGSEMCIRDRSIVGQSTLFLNLGQIFASSGCSPLCLAKHIHWKWPETHGEHAFVIMLRGLHIEMKFWGYDWRLCERFWQNCCSCRGSIASSGRAESILCCSNLTRTRHMHQVSALALANLQQEAFAAEYEEKVNEGMET